jgi:hypothetical protein
MLFYFMEEIWKDIIGSNGLYQISNLGNVKSLSRTTIRVFKTHTSRLPVKEKILKPVLSNKDGYYRVNISGKLKSIHRLIAIHFIPNPNNYESINHINAIKTDNSISNLEWCTPSQNTRHAFKIGSFDGVDFANNCKKVVDADGNEYKSLMEAYKKNHTHQFKWYKTFLLNVKWGKLKYTPI